MHAWRFVLLGILLTGAPTGTAYCAFETLFGVVQPMTTSEGLQTAVVTYSEYITATPLGFYVSYLAADSHIMDQRGSAVSRNVAYLTGARAWPEQSLVGDTLRVFLDLRKFHVDKSTVCCVDSQVVRAIYDCLLINAYNSRNELEWDTGKWRSAEFVDVRVLGDKFASLQGVVACRDIAKLPFARRP